MRKLLLYYAALSLGAAAGCTVHQDTVPSLTGPSTPAIVAGWVVSELKLV